MLTMYLSAAAITLILLIWHIDWQVDAANGYPDYLDRAIIFVICLAFAIMWPSLLAGVFAGKWLRDRDL